jgi:hypothetical protein
MALGVDDMPTGKVVRNPRRSFWDDRDPQPRDVPVTGDVVTGGT